MKSIAHHRPRRRPAFTLVEMMVSTALIMSIMYIIAVAFEKGIDLFRIVKTAGDMQERLRSATTILRQDLTRQHFGNQMLVSDQRLDQVTWRMPGTPSDEGGYFRIYEGTDGPPPDVNTPPAEGVDPDNPSLIVTRSTGTQHVLQFTVRLRPDEYRRDLFFSTDTGVIGTAPNRLCDFSVPDYMRPSNSPGDAALATVFSSRWAEITYFLSPAGQTTASGTVPLFKLYRRQQLLVEPKGTPYPSLARGPTPDQLVDVSTWIPPTSVTPVVNGPKDITVPGRRFGVLRSSSNANWFAGAYRTLPTGPQLPPIGTNGDGVTPPLMGGDLLLSNVISFEIKAMWDVPTDPTLAALSVPAPNPTLNADYPFDYLPAVSRNPMFNGIHVFDTWSQQQSSSYDFVGLNPANPVWNQGYISGNQTAYTIPLRVRLRAIQIKLRIWDQKSQTTRQATIVQDL